MAKEFSEGTKEDLIEHFNSSHKAWLLIVEGKDAEIKELKAKLAAQEKAYGSLRVNKGFTEKENMQRIIDHKQELLKLVCEMIHNFADDIDMVVLRG